MKFITLLKKEFRQCCLWTFLASAIMIVISLIILYFSKQMWQQHKIFWHSSSYFQQIGRWPFLERSLLTEAANLLMVISINMAIVLAVVQFWVPEITHTWSFTIHRPVKRSSILWAKCISAVSCILISQGIIWTLLFMYSGSGIFPFPPRTRILAEGFAIILTCIFVYWGIAMVGINPAKWYTTKIFPLLFAILCIVMLAAFTSFLYWSIAYVALSAIMLIQLRETFLTREF